MSTNNVAPNEDDELYEEDQVDEYPIQDTEPFNKKPWEISGGESETRRFFNFDDGALDNPDNGSGNEQEDEDP